MTVSVASRKCYNKYSLCLYSGQMLYLLKVIQPQLTILGIMYMCILLIEVLIHAYFMLIKSTKHERIYA